MLSRVIDGPFSDSLTISDNGISPSSKIFVVFCPKATGTYNGNIPVITQDIMQNVPVMGISLDTATLSARVINVSCNNANNGAIDLITTGAAVLSYNWTSTGTFINSSKDISGLLPDRYTVTHLSGSNGHMILRNPAMSQIINPSKPCFIFKEQHYWSFIISWIGSGGRQ